MTHSGIADTGIVNMLVDGKIVAVKAADKGIAEHNYGVVAHVFELVSSTKDANGVVTGTAKCKNCTQTANVTNKTNVIPVGYSSQLVDGSTDVTLTGLLLFHHSQHWHHHQALPQDL
ncbi:MAG: hypothetical protein ACLUYZ_03020 [Lachnospiraceae bacterium]